MPTTGTNQMTNVHALVFAASQGVPQVGVVYDPKVSSFLDYIGQDLYTPLEGLTLDTLKAHIDTAVSRSGDSSFLAEGVARLRNAEKRNQDAAARLLGLKEGASL